MTKTSPSFLDALLRTIRLRSWRIVYDESFTSAKKKIAAKNKLKKEKDNLSKKKSCQKDKSYLLIDYNRNNLVDNGSSLSFSELALVSHHSH